MSVDAATVRRIAHLARIAVSEGEIEQLKEVKVEGVEPMTSVTPMKLKMRTDAVTDGGDAAKVLANAPQTDGGYFLVPKVVE